MREDQKAAKSRQPQENDYGDLAPGGRRRAREAALLMLYQMDFGGNSLEMAQRTLQDIAADDDSAAFALQLVLGAQGLKSASDALIAGHSREWEFERLCSVDVTILRLALSELNDSTPAQIVINEAVELAKKFGDEASPAFVNAVLDAVYQEGLAPENGR